MFACNEEVRDNDPDSENVKVITKEQLKCSYRAIEFDERKHKLLNSELKKLYTAITRARS